MRFMILFVCLDVFASQRASHPSPQKLLEELNLARTQPLHYAFLIREYRHFYDGLYIKRPEHPWVLTEEGVAAVDEAIAYLETVSPALPLRLDQHMSQAARDHVRDQGPSGVTGHVGSDGKTPGQRVSGYGTWYQLLGENIAYGPRTARDAVIQLIIDDGVPDRGHRKHIFNNTFRVVGIAAGYHHRYRTMCVMNFSADFAKPEQRQADRVRKQVSPRAYNKMHGIAITNKNGFLEVQDCLRFWWQLGNHGTTATCRNQPAQTAIGTISFHR